MTIISRIYIITIIFSVCFAWLASSVKNKHVSILCSIISVLIPSVVGGLRQVGVGTDTWGYGSSDPFLAVGCGSFAEFMSYSSTKEIGYKLLCYTTMKTLGHVNWCFFFYQLITVGCFYVGAYKHRKVAPLPFIMLLFLYDHWVYSLSMMRQAMAASIIVMGIDHLEKKEYKKFMIYILVAFSFHSSALLCVGLVLGAHMIVTRKSYFRYLIVFMFILAIINFRAITDTILTFVQSLELVPDRYTIELNKEQGVSKILLLSYAGTYIIFCLYPDSGQKLLGGLNLEYYKMNTFLCLGLNVFAGLFHRLLQYNLYINSLIMAFMPFCVKDKFVRLLLIICVLFALIAPDIIYRANLKYYSDYIYKSIIDF